MNTPTLYLNLTNTCVTGNSAQGGGGTFGAGQGGGIADLVGQAFLTYVSLAGNRASGAPSADGSKVSLGAGGALLVGISFGFFPGGAHVVVSGGSITRNAALGGAGTMAGDGEGGGIDVAGGGTVTVKKASLARTHRTRRRGFRRRSIG